ncbi:DUF2922 domain-containing protein [Clostridium botulinum]|uniref:DUF2922 domain-containing protein n=1 Tax=Clostridium botulinum TaxID=1491 RepID=A0A6M0V378_CLOBO|nr:DUF2922 domain-containing protein [Clostridium botulinum]MBY6932173.1 DUF2922 domain-containing protein [Clostridium botulinum]MCS6112592.1 DUF2922 domain-containing protein [Clostridium botulinum]NFE13100.1 DUF2922 domain-containing protein [Clostridium botulinum]NFE61216.1 DUF2922 domain-containing protein [Clostridium botulinum]NFF87289.1 DUF2922 domain-containing protein [Clostridium botulinum]
MEYILSLTFFNQAGSKTSFNINGVKPDLKDSDVTNLMNLIIEKEFLLTSKGTLIKIDSAKLTQRDIKKFDVVA